MLIVELTKEELRQIIKDEIASALKAMERMEDEELITRKAAAEYLDVTLPTLNAWEKNGYITATRLGSRVYFRKSQLAYKPPNYI